MKKFVKIFAVVLAVLMLGSVMIACDNGNASAETTAETQAAVSVTVSLVFKDVTGKEVYKGDATIKNATLGEAIDMYCAGEELECVFDESTGLLTKVGDLVPATGELFIAYDETQGKNKAFDSIKDQVVTDGQTIIVAISK